MNGSYRDVSLVVLDGAKPSEYVPWKLEGKSSLLPEYVSDLHRIEPWISDEEKEFDDYRFQVLFDTPDELCRRTGGWTRVVGCIVDVAHGSTDLEAAAGIRKLLSKVCSSLVKNPERPWFRVVGFHLVSIVGTNNPTMKELSFRRELIIEIENSLQIFVGRGLNRYEVGSPEAFPGVLVQSTTHMVFQQRYWAITGKRIAQYQSA